MEPGLAARLHHLIVTDHAVPAPFDPAWPVAAAERDAIVNAGRWTSTPHELQHFELVIVDDPAILLQLERLDRAVAGAPMLIVVACDPADLAPAAEHDVLGTLGLGCVLETMWLTAHALQLDAQILGGFSSAPLDGDVKRTLGLPEAWRIAFGLRLGHAVVGSGPTVHAPRDLARQVHRNRFGNRS